MIEKTKRRKHKKSNKQYLKDVISLEENGGTVYWYKVSMCGFLTEDFMRRYYKKLDWEQVFIHQKVSESFIREMRDIIDWYWIDSNTISENFVREFEDRMSWFVLSMGRKWSNRFLEEKLKHWDFYELADGKLLTTKFAEKYPEYVDWGALIDRDKFSPEFCLKYKPFWKVLYFEDPFTGEQLGELMVNE